MGFYPHVSPLYTIYMFYSEGKLCSALLIATYRGNNDIVELLIAAGANVHAVDGSGETPLHKASANGHKDIVEKV